MAVTLITALCASWSVPLRISPPSPQRCVVAGALSSALLLLDPAPAVLAVDEPTAAASSFVLESLAQQSVPSQSTEKQQAKGKVNGAAAMMVSSEDAQALKRASESMPDLNVPAGSDLERLLNGDENPGRSTSRSGSASPLAHN